MLLLHKARCSANMLTLLRTRASVSAVGSASTTLSSSHTIGFFNREAPLTQFLVRSQDLHAHTLTRVSLSRCLLSSTKTGMPTSCHLSSVLTQVPRPKVTCHPYFIMPDQHQVLVLYQAMTVSLTGHQQRLTSTFIPP